ncbi:hypothetical protein FA132_30705 [Pseudomonas aeruginosa]|jgi:hypothetical protein|nr:hypothetical protein [Pseudomonas aeruginosa]
MSNSSQRHTIATALAGVYNDRNTADDAERVIAELPAAALAEIIVDAFNRGALSREYFGINSDGEVL